MTAAEIRDQRAALVAKAREIFNQGGEQLAPDQAAELDRLYGEADQLAERATTAERGERLERAEAELRSSAGRKTVAQPGKLAASTDITAADRKAALRAWALHATDRADTSPDILYRAAQCGINLGSRNLSVRALSKGTNSAGGYTVPIDFASEIERKLKFYCPVRNFVRTFATDSGEDLQWPVVDDTGSVAAIVSEAGAVGTATDPTFSQITFKAWKYASPIVKVAVELLQDSAVDIEALLADLFGERMGRGQEAHFVAGDGTTQPQGLATGAGVATQLASGNAITFAKLKTLEHSVDLAYRQGASWLMHDATLSAIEQLVDSQNRPLFIPNFTDSAPGKLFGYPVVVSNSMPGYTGTEGSNQPMILFGDMKRYAVRDISSSMQIARLDELYAANGQVGFVMLQRTDGRYLNASAVKSLNSFT